MRPLPLLAALIAVGAGCPRGSGGDAGAPVATAPDAGATAKRALSPQRAYREAEAAYRAGRADEAIALGTQLTRARPDDALAHNLLGRAFILRFERSGLRADADAAREALRQAITADPAFWPAMINLAALELRLGDQAAAAALYARVLELEPAHPQRGEFERVIAGAAR